MKIVKLFIFHIILILPLWANAQQQIPPVIFDEMHHPHGRMNPNNPNSPYYTPPPQEVWENKYVVITSDFNTGASGFAESTRSLRAARREAMRECGTRQCRISAEATNGCVVIVHGDSSFSTFGAGATYEDAAAKAESNCRANGGRVCSVGFQHCGLPVRIR